jgi:hypothetical protein
MKQNQAVNSISSNKSGDEFSAFLSYRVEIFFFFIKKGFQKNAIDRISKLRLFNC